MNLCAFTARSSGSSHLYKHPRLIWRKLMTGPLADAAGSVKFAHRIRTSASWKGIAHAARVATGDHSKSVSAGRHMTHILGQGAENTLLFATSWCRLGVEMEQSFICSASRLYSKLAQQCSRTCCSSGMEEGLQVTPHTERCRQGGADNH